jgi:S1-C subfamily serine protease
MASIRELSDSITGLIAAASKSVVEVRGRRRPSTGIVWAPDRVVTASHTVQREDGIVVVSPNGDERSAGIVGRDPATDLVLLKVTDGGLEPATWANADPIGVGALVFPLGRQGGSVRAALGIVAERGGAWQTSTGGAVDTWLDVDGSLPAGFSGGPLLDADGAIVGLNTSALTPRGAVLTRSTVERIVDRLEKFGTAAPGYLGAGFYPGTLPKDVSQVAGQPDALMTVSLEPGGPSTTAGLLVGDALVRMDGQPLTGLRHLLALLSAKGAGANVVLTVLRAGALQDIPLTLGARPRPSCG